MNHLIQQNLGNLLKIHEMINEMMKRNNKKMVKKVVTNKKL